MDKGFVLYKLSSDKEHQYRYNITAEEGIGLFVGLSQTDEGVRCAVGGKLWDMALGAGGKAKTIQGEIVINESSKEGTYFIYVGSEIDVLKNVRGTIEIVK